MFMRLLTNDFPIGPARYRETSFEHCLTYDRNDGKRIEMVVTHLLQVSGDAPCEPELVLASYKQRSNPNANPSEKIVLSMAEARLLRDFLNRPEVASYLEEEEENV